MATSIDKKIIEMELRNREFEARSKETMGTLDLLKSKLNFKGVGDSLGGINKDIRKFDVSPLSKGLDGVTAKFSTLGVMTASVINNLTNRVVNFGLQTAKALTITPVVDGMQEYETKLNSIQTILANTQSKGTTLVDVTKALDDLNTYSDKTIYNFAEMTRNIGTFTAAGVDLDTATEAIKGIANLAAISGSNSQQASTAMYQLSQAMASGTVKLMDWNSVVNAGMGGQVFQDSLKETARKHGIAIDAMIKKEGSFRETLKDGWLTTAVLTDTLAKFTGDLSAEQLTQMGYTSEQVKEIIQLGKTANDAATKVKTFTQLMDTLKEAQGSGWAKTWEYLVGDFEQSKKLWTTVSDLLGGAINDQAEARNNMVKEWVDMGGRDSLLKSISKTWGNMTKVFDAIAKGFSNVFDPMTSKSLVKMTESFSSFVEMLTPSEQTLSMITNVFTIFFKVIKFGLTTISAFGSSLVGLFTTGDMGFVQVLRDIASTVLDVGASVNVIDYITKVFASLGNVMKNVWSTLFTFDYKSGFNKIIDFMKSIPETIAGVWNSIGELEQSAIIGGLTGLGLGVVFKPIIELVKGFQKINIFKTVEETTSSLGGMFDNIGNAAKSFGQKIAADNLLNIAKAIGILAIALFVLAMVPTDKLLAGTLAIAGLMTILVATMKALNAGGGIKAGPMLAASVGMIAIAASAALLAVSATLLTAINLPKALLGLLGILTLLATFTIVISKFVGSIFKTAISLMAISVAIGILVLAILPLSLIPAEKMGQGLFAMLVIFLAITSFALAIQGLQIGKVALSLIVLGVAMNLFSLAILPLALLPLGKLAVGLIGIAGALAILVVATKVLNKSAKGVISLIGVAVALNLMVIPILALASIDLPSLIQGLLAVGLVLAGLVIASQFLTTGIVGAVALVLISAALIGLAVAVGLFAAIPIGALIKAVVTITVLFAVLFIAATVATTLAPALLILSVALLAVGVAIGLAGFGMAAFAIGLGILAVTGAAGFAVLVTGCMSLANVLPYLTKKFLEGFKMILQFTADNGKLIVDAFAAILGGMLAAIPLAMMKAGEYFISGFIGLMKVITEQAIPMAEATTQALKAMMTAVETYWVGSDGIAMKFGQLVTTLLSGISAAIREYGPQFITDMEYISGFMAEGLVRGFGSLPNQVIASLVGLKKDLFDIITGDKQNAFVAGQTTAGGYSDGMENTFSARKKDIASAMAGILPGITKEAVNATAVPMAPVVDMTQPTLVLSNYQKALTATHKDAAKMEGTINTNRQIDINVSGNVNATGGNQPATQIFNQANLQQQLMNTMKRELRWGVK